MKKLKRLIIFLIFSVVVLLAVFSFINIYYNGRLKTVDSAPQVSTSQPKVVIANEGKQADKNIIMSIFPRIAQENKTVKFYYMNKSIEVGKTTHNDAPYIKPHFIEIYDDKYEKNFIAYYADRILGYQAYLTNVSFVRYNKKQKEFTVNKTYSPLSLIIDKNTNSIEIKDSNYSLVLDKQGIMKKVSKKNTSFKISADELFNVGHISLFPSYIQSTDLNDDGYDEYLLEYMIKNTEYNVYLVNIMVVVDYKNNFKIIDAYCFDVSDGYRYENAIDGFK